MLPPLLKYLKGTRPTLRPDRQDSQKGLAQELRFRWVAMDKDVAGNQIVFDLQQLGPVHVG